MHSYIDSIKDGGSWRGKNENVRLLLRKIIYVSNSYIDSAVWNVQ